MKQKSFTLVELLVSIVIIGIIVTLVGLPLVSMWNQRHYAAVLTKVKGMLEVARMKARMEMTSYGVCFFVDYSTDKQHAVFIRHGDLPPEHYRTGPYSSSYWNRYADRMVTCPGGLYSFPSDWRVRPTEFPRRNIFVIVFNPQGFRDVPPRNFRYIIHDLDDGAGSGTVTGVPINDITDRWSLYEDPLDARTAYRTYMLDEPIEDIIDLDETDDIPYTEFDNKWGLIVYNHRVWADLLMSGDTTEAEKYFQREGTPILLDRKGQIIQTIKGGEG